MPHPTPQALPEAGAAYRGDLGDHLILRWATPADTDGVAQLFADVLDSAHAAWVRTMLSGSHPHCTAADCALVEDTATAQIVAAANLMTSPVSYAGIPLTLARAAIVGTAAPYRLRGLQRRIFELLHARSAARGHLLQGITGIHYIYRQFGYEYAIDLEATRHVYLASLPAQPSAAAPEVVLRQAQEEDIPVLVSLAAQERACWQVATVLNADVWRWLLGMPESASIGLRTAYLITSSDQQVLGYALLDRLRRDETLRLWGLAVRPDIPLAALAVPILHALAASAPWLTTAPPPARILLEMGPGHALIAALGPYLAPERKYPYAWWMRIPDAPAFLRHIAPVLNDRLAHSVLAGFTGTIAITFYRGGLRLVFARGELSVAEDWEPPSEDEAQAGFPPQVFTPLVLGYHSFADLRHIYKDAWAEGIHRTLLETLFPPCPSYMVPLF